MGVDLSKLSDEDLVALKSGDLSKVSNQGLLTLKGGLSASEQVANDPITKGAQEVLQTSPADLAAANPAVRMGMGAISPVLGAAQMAAEALGSKSITDYLKNLEEMKNHGEKAMEGSPAGDVANATGKASEVVGNFLSMSPASKLATTAGTTAKILQGAKVGAVAGVTAPVVSDDYWGSKGGQVLLGTVIGGAVPAGIEAGKGVYTTGKNIWDMFTQEGAKNILSRYQQQIVGNKNLPEVIAALKSAPELIPGSKPTAAEALVGTPGGSPIAAHERITATTPGGVSAQFGQRKLDQFDAMEKAIEARKAATDPMREAALDAANQGGVKTAGIDERINNILKEPGKRASDLVQKVLTSVKDKLSGLTDESGVIDARDLYTVRKELGNMIQVHAKDTANWDKKLAAGLERDVQRGIDDAIEKAGGTGWRKYLNEFASRTDAMERELERRKEAFRPPQKTDLAGGADVAGQMRVHGPQLLSRPMMVTNYILKKMGESVEKRIDPEAARRYLDPQALAAELEKFSPEMKRTVIQDLIRIGKLPAIGAASSQGATIEGRQYGGPVNRGQPYIVGENGPEVIVPQQQGNVVPSGGEAWAEYMNNVAVEQEKRKFLTEAMRDAQEQWIREHSKTLNSVNPGTAPPAMQEEIKLMQGVRG